MRSSWILAACRWPNLEQLAALRMVFNVLSANFGECPDLLNYRILSYYYSPALQEHRP